MKFLMCLSFVFFCSVCLAAPIPSQAKKPEVDPNGKTVIGVRSSSEGKVNSLYPISPFGKAGGKVGDFIKKIGEDEIDSLDDLVGSLKMYRPGAVVKVEIKRRDKDMTLTVTLGEEAHKKIETPDDNGMRPRPRPLPGGGLMPLPGRVPLPANPGK